MANTQTIKESEPVLAEFSTVNADMTGNHTTDDNAEGIMMDIADTKIAANKDYYL